MQPALQEEPRRSRGVLGPSLAENQPKNLQKSKNIKPFWPYLAPLPLSWGLQLQAAEAGWDGEAALQVVRGLRWRVPVSNSYLQCGPKGFLAFSDYRLV